MKITELSITIEPNEFEKEKYRINLAALASSISVENELDINCLKYAFTNK
jgi:hypothetical protein